MWHSCTLLFIHFFFFSSRRRHTRCSRDWSSDVCSSDLPISRRTTTCAHATTQTTNAVPMAQLGIIHTLHPLRAWSAAKRRRSESNRRIEVLQTSALPLCYGAVGLENA